MLTGGRALEGDHVGGGVEDGAGLADLAIMDADESSAPAAPMPGEGSARRLRDISEARVEIEDFVSDRAPGGALTDITLRRA
jgi:hypothetical protein